MTFTFTLLPHKQEISTQNVKSYVVVYEIKLSQVIYETNTLLINYHENFETLFSSILNFIKITFDRYKLYNNYDFLIEVKLKKNYLSKWYCNCNGLTNISYAPKCKYHRRKNRFLFLCYSL
jgi:hypothetical protein